MQQRKVFIKEMLGVLEEEGIEPELKELILTKMVCFGPTPVAGTNILVSKLVKPGHSFLDKADLYELGDDDQEWILDKNITDLLD